MKKFLLFVNKKTQLINSIIVYTPIDREQCNLFFRFVVNHKNNGSWASRPPGVKQFEKYLLVQKYQKNQVRLF